MILELHDSLNNPVKLHATRVLICYDDGTPAALALETGRRQIRHLRATDSGFNAELRAQGVDRTVFVQMMDARTLKTTAIQELQP